MKFRNKIWQRFRRLSTFKKGLIGLALLLLIAYVFALPRRLFDAPTSTVVTDRHGQLLGARIADDGQWRFPAVDTVPEKFAACLIAFEDRYFYSHWGVNPLAMGRAIRQNMAEGRIVSGGSTLTMQVVRLSRRKPRTWSEKLIESVLATRLEFRYSKQEILALYASYAPFGGNVVGLEAASWRYFGRSADQLSWAEAATLAILPNAPSRLHLARNRESLLAKRNRLLLTLRERGIIDASTYALSIDEPLPDAPKALPQIAPHLVSRFNRSNHGQNVASTINRDLQSRLESTLERWNSEFRQHGINNIAAVVVDVPTNQVLAYCGNVNYGESAYGNQVDIVRSERSSGSIFKPFLFYAMLDEGMILPNTLLPDIPLNINGFIPQNYNMSFSGAVSASQAVSRSLNVPMVYLLRQYSVPNFYNFLKEYGVASLPFSSDHYGLPLILGGAETSLFDISGAYANMARSLLDLDGRDLQITLHEAPKKRQKQFHAAAAWQVFEALKEVNRPEEIDWRTIPSMQTIAWKTGTSFGSRDAWAVGATTRYVVAVWVGNASGEGRPELSGARAAGPVMFDIFDMLPAGEWFARPNTGLVTAEVCRESGCLRGRFCPTYDEVPIVEAGLKTQACPYHVSILVTPDEQYRLYEQCSGNFSGVQRSWFVLPPAWAWYYKSGHSQYRSLPPFLPGCNPQDERPMQFIYPQGNLSRVHLPVQLDGRRGEITFELAHSRQSASVYWHLDDQFVATTVGIHRLSMLPSLGSHTLTVMDELGNTLSTRIVVE